MKTEKEKMLSGELYNALDEELTQERIQARLLLKTLNDTGDDKLQLRMDILKQLMPNAGADLWLQPPFYCDYGYNITTGKNVFFNFNCVVLDIMQVTIGNDTKFGPNVQIYTATHPMNYKKEQQV